MKMVMFILCIVLIMGVGLVPNTVISTVPALSYTSPQRRNYEKKITCNGTIEARIMKEVYLDAPVVADSVTVSVGDTVQKGQILAVIDTELSKNIAKQSTSLPNLSLPEELGVSISDITSLLGLSGMSGGLSALGDAEALLSAFSSGDSALSAQPQNVYIPDVISSPMDGIVTEINIKSDVLTRQSKPVVTIADTEEYRVVVSVNENDIGAVNLLDKAIIKCAGRPNKDYIGYVSKIYPTAKKNYAGTAQETVVDVEVTLSNGDKSLKPGFTARVDIVTDASKDILIVPYEAVKQDEQNNEYVYIFKDSQAIKQVIKTGLELVKGVEVTEGLDDASIVIVNAEDIRKNGDKVRLKGKADVF